MDKNSIIGLLLIGAIFIGFNYYNQPSEEEIAAQNQKTEQARADSTAQVKQAERIANNASAEQNTIKLSDENTNPALVIQDSLQDLEQQFHYGRFAQSAVGTKEYITIENEKIKATISTKGGMLVGVELKEYKTWDSLPLNLFDEDSSKF
ncbi:MAG: membrane protein insertase YidC, partial [Flavobacteriales bacterium]|nr:membrane protein insertase YidC [Flavobacteriales bacterium]